MAAAGLLTAAAAPVLTAASQTAGLVKDAFMYNRKNFQYDRKQRTKKEYQLLNLRVQQSKLWREDVRDASGLTPRKMEVYLLVASFELLTCFMAFCKGSVPPGTPPWLVTCHIVSLMSAIMYLVLCLWFGMHAFISAQAYKVRILTQLVRLPIPTWRTLESSRTYSSAFERMPGRQLFRLPFIGGEHRPSNTTDGEGVAASDPWGLELPGDAHGELQPDVNTNTQDQQHIWLVREAQRYYQTYDAFCRIALTMGSVCLSNFFAYFSLSYVLVEMGVPEVAWTSAVVFTFVACGVTWCDATLTRSQVWVLFIIELGALGLSGGATHHSSKNLGLSTAADIIMPITLFLHGAYVLYFLYFTQMREQENGSLLPWGFKRVLFLDAFGWAKHPAKWIKGVAASPSASSIQRVPSDVPGRSSSGLLPAPESTPLLTDRAEGQALPSMRQVSGLPMRPEVGDEEYASVDGVGSASGGTVTRGRRSLGRTVSFRPTSFAAAGDESEEESGEQTAEDEEDATVEIADDVETSEKIPENEVPWRAFRMQSAVQIMVWWISAVVVFVNGRTPSGSFLDPDFWRVPTFGEQGHVYSAAALVGTRVSTTWSSPLEHVEGLACDPSGTVFLTSGRTGSGQASLLVARAARSAEPALSFDAAPSCGKDFDIAAEDLQDVSMHGCDSHDGCKALVLPRSGQHFQSCPLQDLSDAGRGLPEGQQLRERTPLLRNWLRDADGMRPEQISSFSFRPCQAAANRNVTDACLVVGTTGNRVVMLQRRKVGQRRVGLADSEETYHWGPSSLLNRGSFLHEPGTLSFYGDSHVVVLDRQSGSIQMLDLAQGGIIVGKWGLPQYLPWKRAGVAPWSAICMGGNSLYAMENRENPSVWRFPHLPGAPQAGVVGHRGII